MLKIELKEIIEKYDADVAVLVKNLSKNEILFNFNENKIFPSASIITIPIMIEALNKTQNLEIPLLCKFDIKDSDKVNFSIITEQNLTQCTYLDLITWMIICSDNTAANKLIDILGKDNINKTIKALRMNNTILQRKMADFESISENKSNLTTLEDILIVMEDLYNETIINKKISKIALDILKNQRDNSMLKRYINDNVILANKTGQLYKVSNDIGIFYTKTAHYFIGVFVNNAKNNQEASEIIATISKKTYDYILKTK